MRIGNFQAKCRWPGWGTAQSHHTAGGEPGILVPRRGVREACAVGVENQVPGSDLWSPKKGGMEGVRSFLDLSLSSVPFSWLLLR